MRNENKKKKRWSVIWYVVECYKKEDKLNSSRVLINPHPFSGMGKYYRLKRKKKYDLRLIFKTILSEISFPFTRP